MPLTFAAESHISTEFKQQISQLGFECVDAPHGVPDEQVMAFCQSRSTPLITHDLLDFLVLSAMAPTHPGLIIPPIRATGFAAPQLRGAQNAFLRWVFVNPLFDFSGQLVVITRQLSVVAIPFGASNANFPVIFSSDKLQEPPRKLPFECAMIQWQKSIRDLQAGRT